ncbi:MAG: sigma-70 family RNA polymerase sigma factor [Candidatus Solibacter usitatus]|nr:sigma-70 family RNA polymerase sigma factor [Candidatus Solibacter usitatus]
MLLNNNGPDPRHELMLAYLPLVESIARRIYGTLPPHTRIELHDLAQSGLLGLVRAGRSYDPSIEVPFSTYARYRIEGEILDSLRRLDLAPRKLRRWQKQVAAVRQELAGALQREPTEEELCGRLMISASELHSMNAALRMAAPVESEPNGEGEPVDPASDPDTHPDQIFSQRQLRDVLDRLIENLPARHRQVIRLHYNRYRTMKEIGHEMGVNESRASQIHRSALQAMGRMLRDSGICSPADV